MAYEYQEYPKWIKTPDGREIIVQNEKEEEREMSVKPSKVIKKDEWGK